MKLTVVGVGPGPKVGLTRSASQAILEAQVVIGAKRHLEAYGGPSQIQIGIQGRIDQILEAIDTHRDKTMVVLASGDPLLYGIGSQVRAHHPQAQIISGISALQHMFTLIPQDMNGVMFSSSHGRDLDPLIFSHPKVAMVTDTTWHPGRIAQAFKDHKVLFYIGSNLGYDDQEVVSGSPLDFVDFSPWGLHVVVIVHER